MVNIAGCFPKKGMCFIPLPEADLRMGMSVGSKKMAHSSLFTEKNL